MDLRWTAVQDNRFRVDNNNYGAVS